MNEPRQQAIRRLVLVAPALLTAALVIGTFNQAPVLWPSLVRPLLIAVVGTVAVTMLLWAATRRPAVAALIASLLVPAAFGYAVLSLLLAAGGFVMAAWHRRYRSGRKLPVASWLMTTSLSLLIVMLASAVVSGAISVRDFRAVPPVNPGNNDDLPNIHVLLLDGYPRTDVLEEVFGIDNSGFVRRLERLGFDHYPDASVTVPYTERTLLSMMSGDASDVTQTGPAGHRELLRRIAEGAATERLRSLGYELLTIRPPIGHVSFVGWNAVDTGQLTEFELALMEKSGLAPLFVGWITAQQSERIEESLAAASNLASNERRQVVLTHLMSPHPPFLYPDAFVPGCWPGCTLYASNINAMGITKDQYASRLDDHLDVLNELVLRSVAGIVSADPEAVVVVMSDHGTRYRNDDEGLHNLLLARTPDRPQFFRDRASLDDLFVRLANGYSEAHRLADEP